MNRTTDIYAMPNATDTESIFAILRYTNTVSEGIFFPVMILVVSIITFVAGLSTTSVSKAWAFAGFIATVLSIPLAVLDLIAPTYAYFAVFCLAAGIFWVKLENG